MSEQERSFLPEGFEPTPNLADIGGGDASSFRERLTRRFKPTQFIRVRNIDNETFTWQELPIDSEFVQQPDKVTYAVYRKQPNVYSLEPGQERVIEGASAYIMVEALIKKVLLKRVKIDSKGVKTTAIALISNPTEAENYIDQVVVQVEDLTSLTSNRDARTNDQVLTDLGLQNEPDAPRRGRPPAIKA